MKKTLLILAALLCCCLALKAQDFTYENLNYHVTGTTPPTVTLTGHAEGFTAHDLVIPSTVEDNDGTSYSVTSIGNYAFEGCSGFTGSLTIGSSVTSIGNYAFKGCSGFTGSLTIGSSVTSIGNHAFEGCSGFNGSLTIGNSVTSIGNDAFYGCSHFTGSLTIGNSVESIGERAFYECSGFTGSLTIPNSVTSIGERAFYECSGFTSSLTIGNSVTSIGGFAFSHCSGFTSLTIGSSVESIGDWAFEYTGLTIIIAKPATPPTLGYDAFPVMTDLQVISVPCEKVETYKAKAGWSAFASMIKGVSFEHELTVTSTNPEFGTASITQYPDCSTGSTTVTATPPAEGCLFTGWTENGVQVSTANPYTFTLTADRHLVANYFKQYDFYATCTTGQTLYYRIIDEEQHWVKIVAPNGDNSNGWSGFAKPTGDITLPETVEHNGTNYTVTAIGDCSFYGRIGLTGSLSIPNSVTSIGNYAFYKCSGFTGSLTIGNSVTSIGNHAFYNCLGFTGSLTIGNSVTSIGDYAFYECSGFTGSLTIPNSVTSIGEFVFSHCSGFTGSLTIGNSVTSIGNHAFEHTHIAQIVAKPTTPPAMYYYYAFLNMQELQTIFVPCGSVDAYIANWGFADKIEGASFDHELTVASSNPELGAASITQYSDCTSGLSTVTATPAGINRFTGWMENGVVVSTDNPYSFTLTSDRNLVANFVECVKIYEPVMSMPSPINYDAVYVLGYQDGDNYYLHTSGTAAGEMRLTKNPESPIKYSFYQMPFGASNPILSVLNEQNFFAINSAGVFLKTTFDILDDPYKYYISIQAGDISSQSAPTYTAYHDGDIIRSHEDSNEGNLRLFEVIAKPLYHIAVSATPEGAGTATATCGGETVESALEGTNITVSATPNEGCKFVNWTENDEVVSTANPYTFTLTADRNLVANFFRQYDFSATCTTGQTLYYRIIDAEQHWVKIVAPNGDNANGWNGYNKPTGQIELPETVEHDGTSYTVTEINSYAFYRCDGLTGSLVIPNSVTSIGNDAFYNCTGFNGSLTIPNSVTNIGNNAFNQCSGFTGSLDIPNSVTSIGNNAFKKCERFTGSLIIPNSVTSIGQQAFDNCSGFNGSLTIGNAVTSIGATAFNGCTNFTGTLTIGSSVTSIGDYAFFGCSRFTHIIAKPATPPVLHTNVFEGVTGVQSVTVPCENIQEYKQASNWSTFADIIKGGSFEYELTVASSNPQMGTASITQYSDCTTGLSTIVATPTTHNRFANWTENGLLVSTENPYTFELTSDRNLVANFLSLAPENLTGTVSGMNVSLSWEAPESLTAVLKYGDGDPTSEIGTLTGIYWGQRFPTNTLQNHNNMAVDSVSIFLPYSGTATTMSIYEIDNDSYILLTSVDFTPTKPDDWNVIQLPQPLMFDPNKDFAVTFYCSEELFPASYCDYENGNGYESLVSLDGQTWSFIQDYDFDNISWLIKTHLSTAPYTYNLYRNEVKVNEEEIATTSYTDENLVSNATYQYQVKTIYNGAESNPSNMVGFAFGNTALGDLELASEDKMTLTSNSSLSVNGSLVSPSPDNLILEDNAQLIHSTSGVQATVKKAITGYGEGTGNWYLVSSPVATTSLPVGMKADPAENYDLYRFSQTGDEENKEWLNYKAESFGIENQSGYLYANKNNTTILFRGGFADTGEKELEYVANAEFPGFNLVGNPYPCNTRIGRSFYRMNTAGTELIADVADAEIAPCEGVFVQAQGTGESVTFTPSVTPATRSLPAATVVLTLSQGRSAAAIDRTIVRLGEGDVLGKLMLNADGTRLYIPQNGKDYAVVSTDATRGEMPLNFKAAKNGSYTITVNVENADLNYLHLVDNLTGNDVDLMGSEGDAPWHVSTYTFDAKTDDYASRFKLVFGVKDDTSADSAGDFAFISNGEIIISNEGRATLQVIDVMGRIVSSEEINGDCRISTNGMTAGVYVLNLNGMTQKIVVK